MILTDDRNPEAVRFQHELEARLDDDLGEDLIVVLGGDGFLLRAVSERSYQGTFLGLNAGTVGFLLNDVDNWGEVASKLAAGRWETHRFPLLHARIHLPDGEVVHASALNDVYMERATGSMAHLRLTIDGHVVVEELAADGLVFATALGSTAYTFSAGGPPCHPSLPIMTITPICPHRPRLAPFALPSNARVRVDVLSHERRPARVVTDGRALRGAVALEVSYGRREVSLAFLEGHDFTRCMVSKILTG